MALFLELKVISFFLSPSRPEPLCKGSWSADIGCRENQTGLSVEVLYAFHFRSPNASIQVLLLLIGYHSSYSVFILNFHWHWEGMWLVNRREFHDEVCNSHMTTTQFSSGRRHWHPTPVLLPGKFHGQRNLVGCSPWGRWESDMTERLHFHLPALEKEMATHSSTLALWIPGTGEPCGLPPMWLHRVGHDWSDLAAAAIQVIDSSFCPWTWDWTHPRCLETALMHQL